MLDVEGQLYFPFFVELKIKEKILEKDERLKELIRQKNARLDAMEELAKEAQELNMGY